MAAKACVVADAVAAAAAADPAAFAARSVDPTSKRLGAVLKIRLAVSANQVQLALAVNAMAGWLAVVASAHSPEHNQSGRDSNGGS
jgi:hypothetical protein